MLAFVAPLRIRFTPLFRRIPARPLPARTYKTYLLTLFSCKSGFYLRLIVNQGKRRTFRCCIFPDWQSDVLGCSEAARSQRRHTMRPSGMISPHITQRSSEKYIMVILLCGGMRPKSGQIKIQTDACLVDWTGHLYSQVSCRIIIDLLKP